MPDRPKPNTNYPGLPKATTLLVVEDETRMRELLMDLAPESGFVTTGARSAEEAARLMNAEARDIVLLDLNLPGADGMEFFRTIRERWPEAEVVILTGFGSLDAAREAIHLGVVEFLTKPCPLNAIEAALDRARRRVDEDRQRRLSPPPAAVMIPGETLEDHERRLILAALQRHGGNRTAAAVELGISRRTLHYRLSEYQSRGLL